MRGRNPFLPIGRHIRNTLVAGFILALPLLVTVVVLWFLFSQAERLLQPLMEQVFGRKITGIGAAALAIIFYLMGLLAANVFGRRLINIWNRVVLRIPVINSLYRTSKDLTDIFTGMTKEGRFNRVVLIEYPTPGIWAIGFLTGTTVEANGQKMGLVYIPTSPTPTSGLLAILPIEKVHPTNIKPEEVMKLVVSCGLLTPESLGIKVPPEAVSPVPG